MGSGFMRMKTIKWEPLRLLLVFFIVTGSLFTVVSFSLARDIIINDDGKEFHVHTFSHRVSDVLEETGITLHPKDHVAPSLDTSLPRLGHIDIIRAYPLTIEVDGTSFVYWVREGRVEDILRETGICLGELDEVNRSLKMATYPQMLIQITRIFKQEIKEEGVLSHRVVTQQNDKMDKGFSRVTQRGHDGIREDIIEVTYEDGREVARDLIERTIIRNRQDKIVEEGSNTQLAARGGETLRFSRAMYVAATAYAPLDPEAVEGVCYSGDPTVTASGARAVAGTGEKDSPYVIAVDPRFIPMGSNVYIEGYGYAQALDRGSSMVGNRIDILLATREQALRFGRRQLKIYILP